MHRERTIGVTEAGLALTLVICLLVVFGYMVLHFLGGTSQAPIVEMRAGVAAEPATDSSDAPPAGDEQPQVLTIESSDVPGHALRTSPESELR
jgi:hypothetical protein